MEHKQEQGFVVFSQYLAGVLMQKGFKLIKVRPDKMDEKRNVFIFTTLDCCRSIIASASLKKKLICFSMYSHC